MSESNIELIKHLESIYKLAKCDSECKGSNDNCHDCMYSKLNAVEDYCEDILEQLKEQK